MTDKENLKEIIDRIENIIDDILRIRKSKQMFSSEKYFLQEAITNLVEAQANIKTAIE